MSKNINKAYEIALRKALESSQSGYVYIRKYDSKFYGEWCHNKAEIPPHAILIGSCYDILDDFSNDNYTIQSEDKNHVYTKEELINIYIQNAVYETDFNIEEMKLL